MLEPLFGPAVSAQGYGWYQTPMPVAPRQPTLISSPIPSPFGALPTSPPQGFGGVPPFGAPDVGATALVAGVALRRGQPQGPINDHEIEDFIYEAFELVFGASDVEVHCEGGRVTLIGSVTHKRLKRDLGEIVWSIPIVTDVQNNIAIAARRRARAAARETESVAAPATIGSRKQT